jgi:threonine/homoserine/homoserine lactone efflux protein
MKFLAAAYFLWMAWTLLRLRIGAARGAERPLRMYEAMAFQWVNPKAWIMAIAFVALVVDAGEGHWTSLAALGLGCLALAPLSSVLWMVFGQGLEALVRRTGTERYLGMILAGLMVLAVGLFLL